MICVLISRYYHYRDTSSQKYRDSDFTTIAQAYSKWPYLNNFFSQLNKFSIIS